MNATHVLCSPPSVAVWKRWKILSWRQRRGLKWFFDEEGLLAFISMPACLEGRSIDLIKTRKQRSFKDCRGVLLIYTSSFFITAPSIYDYVYLESICRLSCMIVAHTYHYIFRRSSPHFIWKLVKCTHTHTRLQQRCMMICLNGSQLFWKKFATIFCAPGGK